jgi:hypothetical protein
MPSIMRTEPESGAYFEGAFLPDLFIGALACVLIFPLALMLGGFMFIEPWFIVAVPVTFGFGVLRGNSEGNAWLKGLSMNLVIIILLGCRNIGAPFTLDGLAAALMVVVVTVVPTAGGIGFRRRWFLTQSHEEE